MSNNIYYLDGDSDKAVELIESFYLKCVKMANVKLLYYWGYDNVNFDRLKIK